MALIILILQIIKVWKKPLQVKQLQLWLRQLWGEGGIKVIPDYCLKGLRKLCDKKNILLILDEVQCADLVIHDGFEVVALNFVRPSVSPWHLQLNIFHLNVPSPRLRFVKGLCDLSDERIRVHTFVYMHGKSLRSCR